MKVAAGMFIEQQQYFRKTNLQQVLGVICQEIIKTNLHQEQPYINYIDAVGPAFGVLIIVKPMVEKEHHNIQRTSYIIYLFTTPSIQYITPFSQWFFDLNVPMKIFSNP